MLKALTRAAAPHEDGPPQGATMKQMLVGLFCAAALLSQAAERVIEKDV